MAKYDPLHTYLRKQRKDEFELSFAEMERKIGYMLPKSASDARWWATAKETVDRQVQHRAWDDAGFEAVLIAGADRVRFRRVRLSEVST